MISELEKKLDNALRDAEYERNIRKNLQHVIVSQWGVDAITNCIKQIREVEQSIGPLGPINDYSLAQILSSTLQLPAELIIADLKAHLWSYRTANPKSVLILCRWSEDEDGNWDTACGECFVFETGGPTENRAKWCPYCGRRIEPVGFFQQNDLAHGTAGGGNQPKAH